MRVSFVQNPLKLQQEEETLLCWKTLLNILVHELKTPLCTWPWVFWLCISALINMKIQMCVSGWGPQHMHHLVSQSSIAIQPTQFTAAVPSCPLRDGVARGSTPRGSPGLPPTSCTCVVCVSLRFPHVQVKPRSDLVLLYLLSSSSPALQG